MSGAQLPSASAAVVAMEHEGIGPFISPFAIWRSFQWQAVTRSPCALLPFWGGGFPYKNRLQKEG